MSELSQSIKEYLDYLQIEKNRSPKTRENYEHYLRVFESMTGISRLSELTEDAIREFRLDLAKKNFKKITENYYIIALRNFLKYLVKRGKKVVSPELIELPKTERNEIEVLSYDDLVRLLGSPKGQDLRSLRDKAILEILFSTGLRLAELCNLPRRMDIERGELSVRGKGGKLRLVFLSDGAKTSINQYLEKRGDAEECLFVSLDKRNRVIGKITPRAVERLVDRYALKAGIVRHVHPHQLRHSYATDLLVNGADIRSVQSLLGHSSITTTQIYTHLTNKELKEVHDAFHARRRNSDGKD